jgi:hypothetical protein
LPVIPVNGALPRYFSGGVVQWDEDFSGANTATASAATSLNGTESGWSIAPITGGTTGTVSAGSSGFSTFQNPGTVIITTPATSGQGVAMYKGGGANASAPLGILGANANWQLDMWFLLPATITNYAFRVGIVVSGQQVADPPTGGMWLEYDTANASSNTNIEFRTVSASTSNYVSFGSAPVASTWYHLRIYSNAAGTIAWQLGSANGALSAAVTTTTDIDTTHSCEAFIQVIPRTTAAAATLTIDRASWIAITGRV